MNLNAYVDSLGRELAALAEVGGEEVHAVVERLTGSFESAIRVTLLDALSAATDEITRDLAPGSVELRLRGRDPQFVVNVQTAAPSTDPDESATPGTAPDTERLLTDEGNAARVNLRLPEQLKAAVEEAATAEGRSVNAWLVRAAAAALHPAATTPRALQNASSGRRSAQNFTGWVR